MAEKILAGGGDVKIEPATDALNIPWPTKPDKKKKIFQRKRRITVKIISHQILKMLNRLKKKKKKKKIFFF